MKILFLTKYGQRAASTRYRYLQYLPALERAGVQVEISALLPDAYLRAQYEGSGGYLAAMAGGLRRWRELLRAKSFDLVVLQYEAFPYFPSIFESLLSVPYVLDLDDAIYLHYQKNFLLRTTLGKKFPKILARAQAVTVGNAHLEAYVRAFQPKVYVVPTVVDTAAYQPLAKQPSETVVIGWIGSPSTARYLEEVRVPLGQVVDGQKVKLKVVGAGANRPVPGIYEDWSEAGEIGAIQGFDIGIMPLPDDPWTRGKCGFKLIQYMACAKPVVASPVGVNGEIVQRGETGFLAQSSEEWVAGLRALVDSASERQKMGTAGRARMEKDFSLAVWEKKFLPILGL